MAEKRKPSFVFLLRIRSNKSRKLEIFPADLWDESITKKYRLRVNGKWVGGKIKKFFYKSQIREMLFRAINF